MKGITNTINPNYGYLTQSYFRYIDSEKKAQQRNRNNSLVKQQDPLIEYQKTMTVEEILENINKNENLKVNRKKVLQRMQKEFQRNDPNFKINVYLNDNEPPAYRNSLMKKSSPKVMRSVSPQESVLQNRYTILRKSKQTQKRINDFLHLFSESVADKTNKTREYSSREQKKRAASQIESKQPLISQTMVLKEDQQEEDKKPIVNPFSKLYEKYEDLIISDMNSYGQDMKEILDCHRNKLLQQRAQTSMTSRVKRQNKTYDFDMITNRLCYSSKRNRTPSQKQELSTYQQKFSVNSINATAQIIDKINDLKFDLKRQVKNVCRLKNQTNRSYENQQINYNKGPLQQLKKVFDFNIDYMSVQQLNLD